MIGQSHRSVHRLIKDEQGYTLLELLIAMQLTMMVIGLAIWAYGYTTKVLNKWQENTTDQMDQLRLERALDISVNRIHLIMIAEENLLTGQSEDDSEIRIEQRDSSLIINSRRITGIKKLSFRYYLYRNREITILQQVPESWIHHIKAVEIQLLPDFEKSDIIQVFRRKKWGEAL